MSTPSNQPLCVATVGFFDGVHRGHKHIINQLVEDAQTYELQAVIFSFQQHPRAVLQQEYIPLLLTLEERREQLLRSTAADKIVMLDFTPVFAQQTAEDFMTYLYKKHGVRRLLVGYDHRFGHNRSEGFTDYQRYGKKIGMAVVQVDAVVDEGVNISSSAIRRLLMAGDIARANAFLGYSYSFTGVVVHGRGEGRKMGFPTANMAIDSRQLLPRRGVYGVRVYVEGYDTPFLGMMNIGCRPTFGTLDDQVEVHIFAFDDDIYGHRLTVEVLLRQRDEQPFTTIAALCQQLDYDRTTLLTSLAAL